MSDDDRKSMDDVLASIRRIVRTEKQDEEAGGAVEGDDRAPSETGEPLLLTPEMRSDAGAAPSELAADIADAQGDAQRDADPEGEGRAPDPEALRAMLREILLEELRDGSVRRARPQRHPGRAGPWRGRREHFAECAAPDPDRGRAGRRPALTPPAGPPDLRGAGARRQLRAEPSLPHHRLSGNRSRAAQPALRGSQPPAQAL